MTAWRAHFANKWSKFDEDPRADVVNSRKTCTYKVYFKQDEDTQLKHLPKYLAAGFGLSPKVVNSVARFRLSSHNLMVERGRYKQPPVAWKERCCQRCELQGVVDDEMHMVFECASLASIRTRCSTEFVNLLENQGMAAESRLRGLCENSDTKSLYSFIHRCMQTVDEQWEMKAPTQAEQPQG
jgi:hypothetical protein